jgi:hypothetical protein
MDSCRAGGGDSPMSSAPVADVLVPGSYTPGQGFWDVLLETLSYLEDSSWSGLEAAFDSVDAVSESPLESVRDVARVLSALGHIDVEHDQRTLRPSAWSVSPATFLRTAETEWLLCGSRPTQLVEALAQAADGHGLQVTVERLPSQPARVMLTSAAAETAEAIVEELGTQGHPLELNARGSLMVARALPALRDLLASLLHSAPAVGGAIQKLEPDDRKRLKWATTVDFAEPGAYRFDPPPLTYAFVEEMDAVPARVDARLARLLTVLQLGQPPLAWDPATGVATVPYYAEPPGLYERALSLSGGYGPEPAPYEGVTRYREVTEAIALAVNSRLTSWRSNGDR